MSFLSGIIVNSGQLLLKFGIACVALVGGSLFDKRRDRCDHLLCIFDHRIPYL